MPDREVELLTAADRVAGLSAAVQVPMGLADQATEAALPTPVAAVAKF